MRRMLALVFLMLTITNHAQTPERQVWVFYLSFWTGEASWDNVGRFLDDLPLIGKYNSKMPDVAAQHIAQAQGAGIDAFLVSWFGADERVTTTPALLNILDRAGEVDFAVGAVVDIYNPSFNRDYARLTASLHYLVDEVAQHPAYLRYQDKPVIAFAFQNEARFSVQQWQNLRQTIDPNRETIWLAEGLSACCLYGGAMDGMYAFNMAWASGNADYYIAERNLTLERGATFYIPSISAGWDEQKVAQAENRPRPTSPRDRANGQFLRDAWAAGVKTGSDIVMLTTWNEFMENSHIEPSEQYGTLMLDTLRELIGKLPIEVLPPKLCYEVVGSDAPVYDRPQGTQAIGRLELEVLYPLLDEDYGYYAVTWEDGMGWVSYDTIQFAPCEPPS